MANPNTVYLICVGKQREGNEIKQYKLKDLFGEVCCIESAVLKNMISAGEVNVSNLTLTGDNRLISYEQKGLKDIKPRKGILFANPNHNMKEVMTQNNMYQNQDMYKNMPSSVTPNSKTGPQPNTMAPGMAPNMGVSRGPAAPVDTPPQRPMPVVNPSQRVISNGNEPDPQNSYGASSGSTIFCVTNNGDLGIMHKASKQMKKFHSNVTYACYVYQGHNLHIFFTALENGQSVLRHIIYDDREVKKNQVVCECPSNVGVGKKCNPTIDENGGVGNKPHYYITKDRDYIFVPLKVDNGNGYQVYGFLIYDVRERTYHYGFADDFDSAKSVYSLANTLHQSNDHEISYKLDYSDYDGEGLRLFGLGCGLSLHRPTHSFGTY